MTELCPKCGREPDKDHPIGYSAFGGNGNDIAYRCGWCRHAFSPNDAYYTKPETPTPPKSNVTKGFGAHERMTVEQVLDAVKNDEWSAVLIVGYGDGVKLVNISSHMSNAKALRLIEKLKQVVLGGGE